MDGILQDISTSQVGVAIQENFAEKVAAFGRYYPGSELHEDPELQWFRTPSNAFNTVLRTSMNAEDADIEAKISRALAYFKAQDIPMAWLVGPASQPANLDEILQRHGLTCLFGEIGMAVDMQHMNEDVGIPGNFRIERISNFDMLKTYCTTSMHGFGDSELHTEMYYTTYLHIGFEEDLPWQHYLGFLDEQPVATSTLFLHAGVAGVYDVATMPEARRKGIGAAMTLAALRDARRRRYRIGVLNPSEMGLSVYERLGFREYSRMSLYKDQGTHKGMPLLYLASLSRHHALHGRRMTFVSDICI